MNARDGMSAIVLSFPAILVGVRGGAFLSPCRTESNQISLATGIEVEVLAKYVHTTADVLS